MCFLFSSNVFAYSECNDSSTLHVPCSYNGIDYNIGYADGYGDMYYMRSAYTHFRDGNSVNYYVDSVTLPFGQGYSVITEPNGQNYVDRGLAFWTGHGFQYYTGGGGFNYIYEPRANYFAYSPLDPPPQLTVSPDPVAGGGVASSDQVIECGYNSNNYCQADFPLNSEVELTAYPNTGYAFAYWLDGTTQYTDNPHTFTMDAEKEVEAVFSPTFAFPLQINNYTPYTAPVSSVFDHSGSADYSDSDHQIVDFAGETSNQTYYSGSTCYEKNDSSAFGSGFNYTGTSGTGGIYYLCYNGHPGTDYPVANNTPVYAAADGIAHMPSSFPGYANAQNYNTIEIDHENGYKTYYLHLYSQNVTEDQQVYKGQTIIGYSGDVGATGSYHLHFEVQKNTPNGWVPVDPYGWTGSGTDPYTRATNITLWE
ncbi:MAG: peptidoglycan DD-metalloendopeptidase family protein [Candidatus Moranbacteria bacterium]|nr:peptidoglycan DD-metalloendopeptidase family protein [Candidatus Moranbacteria bacterium]